MGERLRFYHGWHSRMRVPCVLAIGTFEVMLRIALILILAVCSLLAQTPKKPVTDTYDKVKVTDDYRWLENFDEPAVKQWAEAQNTTARAFLDALPDRD